MHLAFIKQLEQDPSCCYAIYPSGLRITATSSSLSPSKSQQSQEKEQIPSADPDVYPKYTHGKPLNSLGRSCACPAPRALNNDLPFCSSASRVPGTGKASMETGKQQNCEPCEPCLKHTLVPELCSCSVAVLNVLK